MFGSKSTRTDVWTSAISIEYLAMSLILLIIGTLGNRIFLQADFFITQNTDFWEEPGIGFNRSQWMWFLTATYFLPTSICFHLIFVVQAYKQKWNAKLKLLTFYVLLMLAVFGVLQAYNMAYSVIDCGVLCIGNVPEGDDENTGADVSVGLIYFSVLLPMIFIYSVLIVSLHITLSSGCGGSSGLQSRLVTSVDGSKSIGISSSDLSLYSDSQKEKRKVHIGAAAKTFNLADNMPIIVTFLVFFPLMLFATASLPNNWQYLSLSGIRSYEAYSKDTDPDLKTDYGTCYTLKLSDQLVLKFYPDILIFYCFIYVFVSVGLLSQVWPPLRRFLYHRISFLGKVYVGEVLALLMMGGLLVGEFLYWYYDHWYQNAPNSDYTSEEIAARCMGQLANVVVGLLILPVARNSVWSLALGISWEGMILYHTYMGGLFLVISFIHAMLFWKVFDQAGSFPSDILAVPTEFHGDNFTIPLAAVTGLFLIIFIGLGAQWYVRRNMHEVFYWAHHFVMILFAMMLWHAAMAWYYITPGLILWAVDHVLRLNNCLGINVTLENFGVEGGGNIISIGYTVSSVKEMIARYFGGKAAILKGSSLDHRMGQYCFLNIPQISPLEWHPFSISCSPLDRTTTHHIKSMGPQQWTGKLLDLAYEVNNGGRSLSHIVLNVDGPYGIPIPTNNYSRFCLIAGGIGVTPIHSYIRHMYLCMKEAQGKTISYDDHGFMGDEKIERGCSSCSFSHVKQVRLVWIVRSESESMIFDKTIEAIEKDNMGGIFSYAIYITRGVKTEASSWRTGQFFYRPDIKAEINDFVSSEQSKDKSLVFACGPKALVELVSDHTLKANVDFRHETFEL